MFDSLIHGEALFEILIEGANPSADGPLTDGEKSLLQAEGIDPSALGALAIGRVVRGGRGVWALTPNRLVMLGQRQRNSIDHVAPSDITRAEHEQGRYGHTVRLQTPQGRWSMYGVDAGRAEQLLAALAVRSTATA